MQWTTFSIAFLSVTTMGKIPQQPIYVAGMPSLSSSSSLHFAPTKLHQSQGGGEAQNFAFALESRLQK